MENKKKISEKKKSEIFIGSDHGGFVLKEIIREFLKENNVVCHDMGCSGNKSADYPEYAKKVAREVLSSGKKGILICGTGLGMSMAANRFTGIRAALCHDAYTARMSREHNDSNILCMGGRVLSPEKAKSITKIWIETEFTGEERHKRRIREIENTNKKA